MKNLLEVADNLERAAGSIPEADLAEGSEVDRERALKLLRSLRDGVLMTDTVLMKVGGGGGLGPVGGVSAGCACTWPLVAGSVLMKVGQARC